VSSGLVRIRGHLGRVHAAQRKAALALGPDLVGKVQVDVRYVQDLRRLGAFLKLEHRTLKKYIAFNYLFQIVKFTRFIQFGDKVLKLRKNKLNNISFKLFFSCFTITD
jgi:hypothetical protein